VHGNGTIGIPWDSHGNRGDSDYITGMGMGVGITVWNGNRAMGMEMNFYCSFSVYHMRICSVIRELAKRSHLISTLARPSPQHDINSSRILDMLCSEWLYVLILTKIIHCFFSVHYYKTFWNSSCFNGNGREWELLVRNKWELDSIVYDFPRPGMGVGMKSWEWEEMGTRKSFPHISNTA